MSRQMQSAHEPGSAASRLFDLRLLIGGLFVVYGVVLIIAGLVAADAAERKAAGININLWMGIGMLIVGVLFLLWWRLQPLRPPSAPEPDQRQVTQTTSAPRSGQAAPRTGHAAPRPRPTRHGSRPRSAHR